MARVRRPVTPLLDQRAAGVLLHPTSLPGPCHVGDLGDAAYTFARFLAAAKQRWWQTLPTGPTDRHGSPYNTWSAFAGSPLLIGLEPLVRDGLLERAELATPRERPSPHVDYTAAAKRRVPLLRRAFARSKAHRQTQRNIARYQEAEAHWLDDFALFAALRDRHRGQPWWRWPAPLRLRRRSALNEARQHLADDVAFHVFVQWVYERQWAALRAVCHAHGVKLLGDVPIFVAGDSADVWANRDLFTLDRDGRPTHVSGAAPDAFSAAGQRWGHPLYRWAVHRRTGYAWWIARFRRALAHFDAVRIDHFLGFARYWSIPAAHRTARRGVFRPGPGAAFFEAVHAALGNAAIIAEDLGLLTPAAAALRDRFGYPGMRVLQFGFGGDDGYHLPHRHPTRCVAYPGTHDNHTAAGWLASASRQKNAAGVSEYDRALLATGARNAGEFPWKLNQLCLSSPANLAILAAQDLLGLPADARMNLPGTIPGNWRWRLTPAQLDTLTRRIAPRLATLTRLYGRA